MVQQREQVLDALSDAPAKSRETVAQDLNRLVDDKLYAIDSPVERALALVGDKYSLRIIDVLQTKGVVRFVELEACVNGISPRTLSARLKHLERYGLIYREAFSTIPPRVEYTLSDKGRAIVPVLESLSSWADCWYPHQESVEQP